MGFNLGFKGLKCFTHCLTLLAPIHTSPYTRWSLWWISAAGISSLTRNSMMARWQNEFCITCLWSRDASYWCHTSLKGMTIVGTAYQTILNRLMLQSCQLCDVAHDFWYDPCNSKWIWIYLTVLNISSCCSTNQQSLWAYISTFYIWHPNFWFPCIWHTESGI